MSIFAIWWGVSTLRPDISYERCNRVESGAQGGAHYIPGELEDKLCSVGVAYSQQVLEGEEPQLEMGGDNKKQESRTRVGSTVAVKR